MMVKKLIILKGLSVLNLGWLFVLYASFTSILLLVIKKEAEKIKLGQVLGTFTISLVVFAFSFYFDDFFSMYVSSIVNVYLGDYLYGALCYFICKIFIYCKSSIEFCINLYKWHKSPMEMGTAYGNDMFNKPKYRFGDTTKPGPSIYTKNMYDPVRDT